MNTYFCIGVSKFWKAKKQPIHTILKKLRNKYKLKWLRIAMSYHKFPNLREILQGDLVTKIMEGVGSKDFDNDDCNCNKATKRDGLCLYEGKCRRTMTNVSIHLGL